MTNKSNTKFSDKYLNHLVSMSLRAPEKCVAISHEKTRLFRYTRNDNSYRWMLDNLNVFSQVTLSLLCFIIMSSCAFPRIVILDDPLSPEEHINLGVAYEKQGELDNALKEYEKASEEIPLAYLYMGNIYLKKNDYENAEVSYKKAIRKDPQNADARNNLAWLYYLTKENLDKAENLALEAIALNPAKKDVYQDTLDKIREMKSRVTPKNSSL